jgi:LCP family protein required for cell wall assembly
VAVVIVCVLACIGVVCSVFLTTYRSTVNDALHAGLDSEVSDALVAPADEHEPFYMLFLGIDGSLAQQTSDSTAGAIILARVDCDGGKVTLISLPSDAYVDLGEDYGMRALSEAYSLGGPKLTVQAVSTLAGVPIAHYAETDLSNLGTIVDSLGGVEVNVAQRIEDSDVSSVTLLPGEQTLDGEQVQLYCQSKKMFADGEVTLSAHQRKVLASLLERVTGSSGLQTYRAIDDVSHCVRTDMDARDVVRTVKALHGFNVVDDTFSATVPFTMTKVDEGTFAMLDAAGVQDMMERVNAGESPTEDPAESSLDVEDDAAGQFTVDVQNGSGVSGIANQVVEKLQGAGFSIGTVGNAESFNHADTLVIYRDESRKAAADSVLTSLGIGHVTAASDGTYTFSGDVLVIIGKDWIPD